MTDQKAAAVPSLDTIEADCWRQLVSAPKHKKSGFNTFTVATTTPDGPDARTVVLRQADAQRKYIWFHSDTRASKLSQLEHFPKAMLLFWDDSRQVQLRLLVESTLHTSDEVADKHWRNLWIGGRKNYLSEQTPGSEQLVPYPGFPPQLGENTPTLDASEAGRPNFAVVECRVLSLDYLHLSRAGQTRARFQYAPSERFVWLAP